MSLEQLDAKDGLTRSTLFHFICGDPKDIYDLDHDLHHHVRHRRSWRDISVNFKSSKEIFEAFKDLDKNISAFFDVLSRL